MGRRIKVAVCTSYPADREPRAPRHALALAEEFDASVVFIDTSFGSGHSQPEALKSISDLVQHSIPIPTKHVGRLRRVAGYLGNKYARKQFSLSGRIDNRVLNPWLKGMRSMIEAARPDLVMAHNIDTLLPAYHAANKSGAALMFDSMEFHSEMGTSQDSCEQRFIQAIEKKCYPACDLITTSSHRVSAALQKAYGVQNLLPLYNVPTSISTLPRPRLPGFHLYWRNSTVGLGQRGLGDVIEALTLLPDDIHLNLQGRPSADNSAEVRSWIDQCNVSKQVTIHAPFQPEQVIDEACQYQVGLCLEHDTAGNHLLTVSNKMFDYHMAGLAVISSDLPPLRDVIEKSRAGILYKNANVQSLAIAIRRLYDDRNLLSTYSANARKFALESGNLNSEMKKFKSEVSKILDQKDSVTNRDVRLVQK